MHLKLLQPTGVVADTPVTKIIAEADDGLFCLLPRHVDFVATLVPSVLYFWPEREDRRLAAIDDGVLVKCGDEVRISAFSAVLGDKLAALEDTVRRRFLDLDEHERQARSAVSRLEAGTLRRFSELEQGGRG